MEEKYHRCLSNRLTYIFLELPKFKKREDQLDGNVLEGMYFCLKNMHLLQERPKALTHNVFDKIFNTGESIMLSDELRTIILEKMNTERDLRNQMAYAIKTGLEEGRARGLEEGRAEGRAEIIKAMVESGISAEVIAKALGLTVEEIDNILV